MEQKLENSETFVRGVTIPVKGKYYQYKGFVVQCVDEDPFCYYFTNGINFYFTYEKNSDTIYEILPPLPTQQSSSTN